jgi:hypothetical protein
MDEVKFSVNLINGILQYLDTRPHGEVRRLIDAIQQEASTQGSQQAAVSAEATPAEATPAQ